MKNTIKQFHQERFRTDKTTETRQLKVKMLSFENELSDAIEARAGKTPFIGEDAKDQFIKLCTQLRSLPPDSTQVPEILDRIHNETLFLLSDGNWAEFEERIYPLAQDREEAMAEKKCHPECQTNTVAPKAQVPSLSADASVPITATKAVGCCRPLKGQPHAAQAQSSESGGAAKHIGPSTVGSPEPKAGPSSANPANKIDAQSKTASGSGQTLCQPISRSHRNNSCALDKVGSRVITGVQEPKVIEIVYGDAHGTYVVQPVARLFRPIEGQKREELKKSIKDHGQQEPVVLDGGTLLDGQNRVSIMNELRLPTRTVEFADLNTKLTPGEWILVKNLNRRHLTDDQVLAIAAEAMDLIKAEQENHQSDAAQSVKPNPAQTQSAEQTGDSDFRQEPAENTPKRRRGRPTATRGKAKALAATTGSSRFKAEEMLKLRNRSPQLADEVKAGQLSLKDAKRRLNEEEQPKPTKPQPAPDEKRVKLVVSAAYKQMNALANKGLRKHELIWFWTRVAALAKKHIGKLRVKGGAVGKIN